MKVSIHDMFQKVARNIKVGTTKKATPKNTLGHKSPSKPLKKKKKNN
jgi:hypothetical protein